MLHACPPLPHNTKVGQAVRFNAVTLHSAYITLQHSAQLRDEEQMVVAAKSYGVSRVRNVAYLASLP